ncbi:MAG: alpha/beta fold hydrolase [Promethearchaeota archaeon]
MPRNQIQDINMYYEIIGEGQPLLLIHGLGSSTRDWEEQVPAFSQKYQVITIDLRGHGKTDKPKGPYSIPMFAQDIAELMRSLNINQVNVIGISLGGSIAFQFAIDYPKMVKNLIIVNTGVEFKLDSFKARFNFFMRKFIVSLVGMKKMGEVLAPRLFIKPEQEDLRRMLIERWAENDKKAYLSALKSFKGWTVKDRIHTISCPTLVISSDGDYTSVSVKEEYTALIPNGKVKVIDDARHAVTMEKPKEFNEVVMEFLYKHSS